jgi:aryl-alcohol dehydrogenase-like predicted oxidoreductase
MKYRNLGATGLKVSQLCLGTLMFGRWGVPDRRACERIIHRSLDAGIDLFDTGDLYSNGESETFLGGALVGRRSGVVIATKLHASIRWDPSLDPNFHRWIIRECERSLDRLGTDYIDIYQIHRPPASIPIDETIGALSDLVLQGKVRYLGASSSTPSQVVEAQWATDREGKQRLASEQPPYSMLVRGVEAELLPICEKYDVSVLARSPLAGGWLSGNWRKNRSGLTSSHAQRHPDRYNLSMASNKSKLEAADALGQLADESGLTLIQMALAFVLQHPAVTSVIIGPQSLPHLEAYLGGVTTTLGIATLDRIDEIVKPGTNFSWADAAYEPLALVSAGTRRRSQPRVS